MERNDKDALEKIICEIKVDEKFLLQCRRQISDMRNSFDTFSNKENWFKELLYKIKILKPKYKELGKIMETKLERSK